MIELRDYQLEAVERTYHHLKTRENNPCIVIPTAGGKTFVIAKICMDAVIRWSGRVCVVAHRKELLEQTAEKLQLICPEVDVGIHSAGLKRRDTDYPVIVAGIHSIYKKACELNSFDLILVDESHLIPPDGEGMYQTFFKEAHILNPHLRVIGLTATPYRLKSGMICGPNNILNRICYEIGVRELIVKGHICPLITKTTKNKIDTSGLHHRGGEYIEQEIQHLMDQEYLIRESCSEIMEYTSNRKACLIFATGIDHGNHIAAELSSRYGVKTEFVNSDTPTRDRDHILQNFRDGKLKYLVNVNILTTGFDAPNIDCVALLRPTLSPGLYYQMVGRGFRTFEGKDDCLVLDFGGNVLRHGPVDNITVREPSSNGIGEAPVKECPECQSMIAAGYAICPDCGHAFPPPERQVHEAKATCAPILSGQVSTEKYEVQDVHYYVHIKRGAGPDDPKTMRVEYQVGLNHYFKEWICIEHDEWAGKYAASWWRKRSQAPVPNTAEEAVRLAKEGALAATTSITVRKVAGEKYDKIIDHEIGDKPDWEELLQDEEWIGSETDLDFSWIDDVEAPF